MGGWGRAGKDLNTRPVNPMISFGARPKIMKLDVSDFVSGLVGHGLPTFRIDHGVDVRVENGHCGIGSQRTPQRCTKHLRFSSRVLWGHCEFASLETEASLLLWILSRLCGEGHVLAVSRVQHAVLEHCRCVAVYEVHRAVDVAVFVELTPRNRPKCVLDSLD